MFVSVVMYVCLCVISLVVIIIIIKIISPLNVTYIQRMLN